MPTLLDEHHCYTDEEARAALARLQESYAPTTWGPYEAHTVLRSVAALLGVATIVLIFGGPYLLTVGLGVTLTIVLAVSTCLAAIGAWLLRPRRIPDEHLKVLDDYELRQVVELAQRHPEIARAVGRWLNEGKRLRERDMRALRRFKYAAEDRELRHETQSALKGLRETARQAGPRTA